MKLPSRFLVNLAKDIGEKTNVAEQYPDIVADLEAYKDTQVRHLENAN